MIKRIVIIAAIFVTVLSIIESINMLPKNSHSLTGDSDFLKEDDGFSLIFIYYSDDSGGTYRYIVYPDRTIVFSYGSRQYSHVETPVCLEKIEYAYTRSVSYIKYSNIMRLAKRIDDSINTRITMSSGGYEFFIVFDGNYYRANIGDLSEENYKVLDNLRRMFGAPDLQYGR